MLKVFHSQIKLLIAMWEEYGEMRYGNDGKKIEVEKSEIFTNHSYLH